MTKDILFKKATQFYRYVLVSQGILIRVKNGNAKFMIHRF